jgi:transposase
MNYVGIDHHRQYSHLTMMDQEGQVLRSGRVPNLRSEIEKFLAGEEAMEAVLETGRSSYTMVDVLEELGVAVKIARLPVPAIKSITAKSFLTGDNSAALRNSLMGLRRPHCGIG